MENSTILVFSIFRNVEDFVRGSKDIDIFKKSHFVRFQKSSKYYAENSKRIYSDIENGYYTLKELAIFLLYQRMMGVKKFSLYKIKSETIKETMKLFTKKRIKEDLDLLMEIHKQMKFKKGICQFFELQEDGTNIAYILTKNERISPTFFIRNYEKCLTFMEKDDIIKSKELEQFIKIACKVKCIL